MKKFQFKILIASLTAFFIFSGCSRLIDAVWNSDAADFKITASSAPGAPLEIQIQIPKSDHLNSLRTSTDQKKGKYFWGYYVYRNSISPYEDFYLMAVAAQATLDGPATNSSTLQNSLAGFSGVYADTSCTSGKTYYYRVAVVYREFDGNEWTAHLEDKSASSWVAALCQ